MVWAACFLAVLATFGWAPLLAKALATLGFLYAPGPTMDRRGEDYADLGLSLRWWRRDLAWAAVTMSIVFPLFIGLYVAFTWALPLVPLEWVTFWTPYRLAQPEFRPRLPDRFWELVVDQVLVVAIPEEFFYRGYLQTRLSEAWPRGPVVLGVRLGPAFWLTQALFALGHLAVFQVWRLAVFFPALLFGWLRARTGSVLPGALVHAASNLLVMVLDWSFFGPR